jgi:hypothetical protein
MEEAAKERELRGGDWLMGEEGEEGRAKGVATVCQVAQRGRETVLQQWNTVMWEIKRGVTLKLKDKCGRSGKTLIPEPFKKIPKKEFKKEKEVITSE